MANVSKELDSELINIMLANSKGVPILSVTFPVIFICEKITEFVKINSRNKFFFILIIVSFYLKHLFWNSWIHYFKP